MHFRPSVVLVGKDVRGESQALQTKHEVQRLRMDVDRLFMISEALWTILKEKHGYTDEHIQDLVAEIDMRDGKLDGQIAPTEAPHCPQCDAKVNKQSSICIFCGTPIIQDPFQR